MIKAHIPVIINVFSFLLLMPWILTSKDPKWILIHLLFLGVITNLIFIWSTHFATTLLRLPNFKSERRYLTRVLLLNLGIPAIILGRAREEKIIILMGALLVILAAIWQAVHIYLVSKYALPTRFLKLPRFYIASTTFLAIGAVIGGILSQSSNKSFKDQLLVAHFSANIFGWVGISVAGTLITLFPTMLRIKLPNSAERNGYAAFPILVGGVLGMIFSALVGNRILLATSYAIYVFAWMLLLKPHIYSISKNHLRTFSIRTLLLALAWMFFSLFNLFANVLLNKKWKDLILSTDSLLTILGVGFALQIALGALSYLIPVVLGGGPQLVRKYNDYSTLYMTFRICTLNFGLLFLLASNSKFSQAMGVSLISISILTNILIYTKQLLLHYSN